MRALRSLRSSPLAALAVALLAFGPSLAAACPACTGQNDRVTNTLKVVGGFLLLPFLVTGVVLWVIRGVNRDEETHL